MVAETVSTLIAQAKSDHDLTSVGARLLLDLATAPAGLQASTLARDLDKPYPEIAGFLKHLSDHGLVVPKIDYVGGRGSRRYFLTEYGQALVDGVRRFETPAKPGPRLRSSALAEHSQQLQSPS